VGKEHYRGQTYHFWGLFRLKTTGDRITKETDVLNAVSCKDRRKLTEQFAIATLAYSDAVAQLARHRGATSEPEYHRLQIVVV
jgi:hypothetical protein